MSDQQLIHSHNLRILFQFRRYVDSLMPNEKTACIAAVLAMIQSYRNEFQSVSIQKPGITFFLNSLSTHLAKYPDAPADWWTVLFTNFADCVQLLTAVRVWTGGCGCGGGGYAGNCCHSN